MVVHECKVQSIFSDLNSNNRPKSQTPWEFSWKKKNLRGLARKPDPNAQNYVFPKIFG